jgi:small subunit ribosomal protein S16
MQRTGRTGTAQYRIVVQDSRRTPTSGNIVTQLGYYDPHTKVTVLDKEKVVFYLTNGAKPSERVIKILNTEKIKLPDWISKPIKQSGKTKHPDKLRKNQPAKPVAAAEPVKAETVSEPVTELVAAETEDKPSKSAEPASEKTEPKPEATAEDAAPSTDDKTAPEEK